MVNNEDRRSGCKTSLTCLSGHCFQEYDHPYILLQRRNSYFYKLVQETGSAMADQLLKVAQEVRQNLLLAFSMTDLLNQWIMILRFETKYLHIFLQKHKGFFFSLTHIRNRKWPEILVICQQNFQPYIKNVILFSFVSPDERCHLSHFSKMTSCCDE
jgi:hypothetical protein